MKKETVNHTSRERMREMFVRRFLTCILLSFILLVGVLCKKAEGAFGRSSVGTTGAAFLKIGAGAKPVSMGEAYVGIGEDVHAQVWNPGGMGYVRGFELTAMHMQYFQGIEYEYGAMAYPLKGGEKGVLGFSIRSLNVDEGLEKRTADTATADSHFEATDSAYSLGYGYRIGGLGLGVGGNINLIRQEIDTAKATAVGVDVGVYWRPKGSRGSLGMAIRNFGQDIKFNRSKDPQPTVIVVGGGYRLLGERLRLAGDIRFPRDNDAQFGLGGEYSRRFGKVMGRVRGGYTTTGSDVGGLTGYTVGGGVEIRQFGIDFGYLPFGDLGPTYRYALTVKF